MKYAFVILHYRVIAETITCINSIKTRIKEPVDIVVVDNASPNKTGVELRSMYKDDDSIVVLLNEKNLGFANGNNVGIHYARSVLNSDFVIVLNNDTYLVQDDFIDVISAEWEKSHFAVMGPKIHTFSNYNQNPMPWIISSKKQVDRLIRSSVYQLIRIYLGIDAFYCRLKECIKKFIGFERNQIKQKIAKDGLRQENVKLHGCCYVFSPVFFEYFDGFDSRTFMYAEEDILYAHMKNKGLLMVYNPKLEIFHARKAATKALNQRNRQKEIFICKNTIKSLKVLKSILS